MSLALTDPQNDYDTDYKNDHEMDFGALGFMDVQVTAVVTKNEAGFVSCVSVSRIECKALFQGLKVNLKPLMNEWAIQDLEDEIRERENDQNT